MGQIPNESIDRSIFDATTNAIERFKPTTEETVVIGFDEFFMPKLVWIKDVLNKKKINSQGKNRKRI